MKLCDLPPEVLDMVFSLRAMSASVLNIWKCGDKRMNTLLVNGGVTRMDLSSHHRLEIVWPRMLANLRFLRFVSVRCANRSLGDPTSLGLELQKLSGVLEELHLSCFEAESAFLVPTETFIAPLFENGPQTQPRFWDIASKFPKLHTLLLWTEYPIFESQDLSFLPPSLTELRLGLLATGGDTSRLPRGLKTLHQPSTVYGPTQLSNLPQGLTSINNFHALNFHGSMFHHLPKSITHLCPPIETEMDAEFFQSLPPHLNHLIFTNWNPSAIPHLPSSNLKTIGSTVGCWKAEDIRALPNTVTKLSLYSFDWAALSAEDWPSSLQELLIDSEQFSSASQIAMLPRGLKRLFWRTAQLRVDSQPDSAISSLPPSLTELSCKIRVGEYDGEISPFPCLNLTRLALYAIEGVLDHSFISALPPSLDSLDLTLTTSFDYHVLSLLPPSIRALSINGRLVASCDLLSHLPKTGLTELQVFICTGELTGEIVSQLSQSLKTLFISGQIELEPGAMKRFPRSITNMTLRLLPFMSYNELQDLPRSLKRLCLSAPDNCLRDAHIEALPRTLVSISISSNAPGVSRNRLSRLTLNALKFLPAHLELSSSSLPPSKALWNAWKNEKNRNRNLLYGTPDRWSPKKN